MSKFQNYEDRLSGVYVGHYFTSKVLPFRKLKYFNSQLVDVQLFCILDKPLPLSQIARVLFSLGLFYFAGVSTIWKPGTSHFSSCPSAISRFGQMIKTFNNTEQV